MQNIIYVLLRRIHVPLIALICAYAAAILGFVLIPGADNNGNVWNMDFFHAFYFVSFLGTTIGLGEIPYPFTDAQRLWATISIYGTVIAWLYGIGAMLQVLQDPAFKSLSRVSAFRRSVNRISEPFFLVCGYGDTGSMLVRALSESGYRSVVIDLDQNRITALELEDLRLPVPGLCANAAEPDNLVFAGIRRENCRGVIALTNIDEVNLKVAITSKLMRPKLPVSARAETPTVEANMSSFGTDQIINPFDLFAGRLALALNSPSMYMLFEWMTAVPHEPLHEPLYPPHGRWILCGYGRFGKAVYNRLICENEDITLIEAKPDMTSAPEGTVIGAGTEASTLQEAGIEGAVGIVAGTDNDTNNLSIIMTARDLNPELFLVARQNLHQNDVLFDSANLNLAMRRGSIIANKIFALITTPLLADFLRLASRNSNEWAKQLVSRIASVSDEEVPQTWGLILSQTDSPAICGGLEGGSKVRLSDLYRDPRNRDERMPCFALLIKRDQTEIVLPEDDEALRIGDRILLCGRFGFSSKLEWIAKNGKVFDYLVSGQEGASSTLWKRFSKKTSPSKGHLNSAKNGAPLS